MFDSFSVCDNTKVHDIIKLEKEEKDANKEDSNWSDHDVTDLNGLLIMVKPCLQLCLRPPKHIFLMFSDIMKV